ncbi:Metallo-hydrolase/oxidoreductase [Aureobasidium sp. EXF-3400]|nr:Metallo-hydrolase/oxidoreductase [Aureobasidium sp. EXF-12344]KAI4777820.1 Metallo-hydrolase/oxidoreductase [Aureobasidium sp. EXF-3400]
MATLSVTPLPSKDPAPERPPAHWTGNPPTSFKNPWPSFAKQHGLTDVFRIRFSNDRNFVPVPESRDELVKVRKPDWGRGSTAWQQELKATWLGHAGWLVETACSASPTQLSSTADDKETRGIRILFDAVFSERTSPVGWFGPRRYTPTPCTLDELPEVDLVVISHNHYDHLDIATISNIHFFAALGNKQWFLNAGVGILEDEVTECDWWDSLGVEVEGVGSVKLTCTPAQHTSGRTPFDAGQTLWSSWVVEDVQSSKKLFFSGDTAYKATSAKTACPAFKQIGEVFGGFNLAMVPIGLYSPQWFMSNVHCCPEDSLQIHKDIRSKKTIGMHYGTVRGGLSAQYEDVREPPKRWRECCENEGRWETECWLCDVGETVTAA